MKNERLVKKYYHLRHSSRTLKRILKTSRERKRGHQEGTAVDYAETGLTGVGSIIS
jgi:hypothetical protein